MASRLYLLGVPLVKGYLLGNSRMLKVASSSTARGALSLTRLALAPALGATDGEPLYPSRECTAGRAWLTASTGRENRNSDYVPLARRLGVSRFRRWRSQCCACRRPTNKSV